MPQETGNEQITAEQLIRRLRKVPGKAVLMKGILEFERAKNDRIAPAPFAAWMPTELADQMYEGKILRIQNLWIVTNITSEKISNYNQYRQPGSKSPASGIISGHVKLQKVILAPFIPGTRYFFAHEVTHPVVASDQDIFF